MLPLLLGLAAGTLSTVAGMGGGMLLVLSLSLATSPLYAVAHTAPALLLANAHRAWLYRAALDRRVAGAFIVGTVPGALVGSLVAVALPDGLLPWVLLGIALFAVGRSLGWIRWSPGPRALAPAGAATGGLAAVSGAGMVGPVLFAAGLRGDAFIATASASAVAMHLARMIGYGAGGLFRADSAQTVALLTVGLLAGNLAGRAIRDRIGETQATRVDYATMLVLVALALAGVH